MALNNFIVEGNQITLVEIWRPIINYYGFYVVSNMGRVKRLPTTFTCGNRWGRDRKISFKERILKQGICGSGYFSVSLCKNNKSKHVMVHKLVADAFLIKENGKDQINHKNGNKLDNRLDNLERVSRHENMIHSYHVLKNQCVGQKQVIDIETGIVYDSIMDAFNSKKYGFKYSTISRQLSGSLINKTPLQYA